MLYRVIFFDVRHGTRNWNDQLRQIYMTAQSAKLKKVKSQPNKITRTNSYPTSLGIFQSNYFSHIQIHYNYLKKQISLELSL